MKIITGRRHWVLTEESPRLTMMDDNNTLAVFAGYYTRSLFPLPAFLNDVHVAGIHPGLIKLNEIKSPVLEFFLTCTERDSLCYIIFVSSQVGGSPSRKFLRFNTIVFRKDKWGIISKVIICTLKIRVLWRRKVVPMCRIRGR